MDAAEHLTGELPFAIPATKRRFKGTRGWREAPRTHLGAWFAQGTNEGRAPRGETSSATPRSKLKRTRRLGLGFLTLTQRGSHGVDLGLYRSLITHERKKSRGNRDWVLSRSSRARIRPGEEGSRGKVTLPCGPCMSAVDGMGPAGQREKRGREARAAGLIGPVGELGREERSGPGHG